MTGRRAILGLCVLCTFALSAVAAQNASAVTGTTLFTCNAVAEGAETTKGFKDAHCTEPVGNGTTGGKQVKFEHVESAQDTTTELKGTTINTAGASTPTTLKATISGINVEIRAELSHLIEGSVTNKKDATTGEHYFEGSAKTKDTNTIVISPAGKGCVIKGGEIETNKLKLTTLGQGMTIKVEPAAGAVLSEFTIEGCSIAALNGVYKLEGSYKCVPNGATETCSETEITAQGTLKLRGQKAGIDSVYTTEAKDPIDLTFKPISNTTVVT